MPSEDAPEGIVVVRRVPQRTQHHVQEGPGMSRVDPGETQGGDPVRLVRIEFPDAPPQGERAEMEPAIGAPNLS
jgi:hypothetical protein